jgi:hypothetical protein
MRHRSALRHNKKPLALLKKALSACKQRPLAKDKLPAQLIGVTFLNRQIIGTGPKLLDIVFRLHLNHQAQVIFRIRMGNGIFITDFLFNI